MPKIYVVKSDTVSASIETVYENISNLNHWKVWSPWLITEPGAKVTVSEDQKFYSWVGKRVGSGEMKITAEEPNKTIDIDLAFLKPFKSFAKVRFELKGSGTSTEVRWIMNSSLPFFMFFFKKMMEALIGMDFQRGLTLLKDYCADGEIHSKLEFIGERTYPGCQYIGITRDCAMADIGKMMEADFTRLWEFLGDDQRLIAGEPFSAYHKWEVVKGTTRYTAGVPVKEIPAGLPADIETGKRESMKVQTLRHIGPYHHLGNAWTTMQMMMRNKEFKPVKGHHPFESYVNTPGEVPEFELITDINFAIK